MPSKIEIVIGYVLLAVMVWLLIVICLSPTKCDAGSTYHDHTEYSSELMCEEAGLKILRSGTGMAGKAAICMKAIKP